MSQWFCSTVYVQNIKDEMKTKKNILISVYKDFEQFFDIPGGTNQDSNVDDEETAAESQQALIKTVRNKLYKMPTAALEKGSQKRPAVARLNQLSLTRKKNLQLDLEIERQADLRIERGADLWVE